jgi:hypothetical protein
MEIAPSSSRQELIAEAEQKEIEFWDAHDAFMIAREALASIRNRIKEMSQNA